MGGEYTAPVLMKGIKNFLEVHQRVLLGNQPPLPDPTPVLNDPKIKALAEVVPPRPPGFCIGCPERPIFAAMKMVEGELGQHHISGDIGCHLFSILPPFNIGSTTMGYGLGPAAASAFNVEADKRVISVMGTAASGTMVLPPRSAMRSSTSRMASSSSSTIIIRRQPAGRTYRPRAR